MKAIILAAGFGLRLRPLTNFLPKSMVPISNRPLLEYIIRYLKQAEIEDIVINLHHLPNVIIDYFKDGRSFGVKINYSFEKEILGTAGGIKAVEALLKDDLFFVINSDIAFELNFNDVVKFHKKNNALATMVLRKDKNVEKYGPIEIDKSCRVRRFLNFSNQKTASAQKKRMFTGISLYNPNVLKEFPDQGFCDIAQEIYPKFIKKNLPIYGFVTEKYWLDIGNPKNYLHLQRDILSGKVFKKIGDNKQTLTKKSYHGVKLIPPVVIGENAILHKDSIIGPFTSIGRNCTIKRGSTLKNSILWDNTITMENSKIENSIVYDKENFFSV